MLNTQHVLWSVSAKLHHMYLSQFLQEQYLRIRAFKLKLYINFFFFLNLMCFFLINLVVQLDILKGPMLCSFLWSCFNLGFFQKILTCFNVQKRVIFLTSSMAAAPLFTLLPFGAWAAPPQNPCLLRLVSQVWVGTAHPVSATTVTVSLWHHNLTEILMVSSRLQHPW